MLCPSVPRSARPAFLDVVLAFPAAVRRWIGRHRDFIHPYLHCCLVFSLYFSQQSKCSMKPINLKFNSFDRRKGRNRPVSSNFEGSDRETSAQGQCK